MFCSHRTPPVRCNPKSATTNIGIPVPVDVSRPSVGDSSQSGRQDVFFIAVALHIATEPDDATHVVVVGHEAPQVGHDEIDRAIPVEIAGFHVAGMIQASKNAWGCCLVVRIDGRYVSVVHVTGKQQGQAVRLQPCPTQVCDRRRHDGVLLVGPIFRR